MKPRDVVCKFARKNRKTLTMKKLKYSFLIFLISLLANGQKCLHTNLSKSFNFAVELERVKDSSSCKIILKVIDKKTSKNTQEIIINSEFIFEKDFKDCGKTRSYSTKINDKTIDEDNDFGDLIIADFDFDGKEDFAIKKDSGGNGGPLYEFYIQKINNEFVKDDFLTNTLEFFPSKIDNSKKTLTTLVHANAYQRCKMIYKYNPKIKKWKRISKSFVE